MPICECLRSCCPAGPAEVTQPGFSAWSGFLGTLLYYQSSHVLGILSREEAKALVISCFVLHGLLVDLTGQPIDYTYPIARMIHGEQLQMQLRGEQRDTAYMIDCQLAPVKHQ